MACNLVYLARHTESNLTQQRQYLDRALEIFLIEPQSQALRLDRRQIVPAPVTQKLCPHLTKDAL
jgi:hypothetical protein